MLSTWMLIPVAATKSAMEAAKFAPSPPIHCVWIETAVPSYSRASAASSSV
jgi:hypothetical protein